MLKKLPVPILLQVSLLHLVSHVYIMTVPSLLPLLPGAISVGFVNLGVKISLFNIMFTLVFGSALRGACNRQTLLE